MDDYEQYCTVKPSFVVERIVEPAEKELCPKVPFPPIVQGQRIHTFKLTPRVLIAIFGTVSVSAIGVYIFYQRYQKKLEEREKEEKERRRIEIEVEERSKMEIEERRREEMEEKRRREIEMEERIRMEIEEKKKKEMKWIRKTIEEIEKNEIEERRKEITEKRRMGGEKRRNEVEEQNWCARCWKCSGVRISCGHYFCVCCIDDYIDYYDDIPGGDDVEFECFSCKSMTHLFSRRICVVCWNQSWPNLMLPRPCGHFSCISCWDYNHEDSCGICTDMDRIFDRY